MPTAEIKEELNCSICREIYTDPVTLPCGHSFCRSCIRQFWDKQEDKEWFCPECRHRYRRRPELIRNPRLSNIAERFHLIHNPKGEPPILCSFCINSRVAATKSCLLCETSLCEQHRGHNVELLSEASETKKLKLRNILENLNLEREETGKRVETLQGRRKEVQDKAVSETEQVPKIFSSIRERLEALEKRVLSEISRLEMQLSLPISDSIHKLQLKKYKLSKKIHHIEELCNSNNPLLVLLDEESERDAMCWAERGEGLSVPPVGDLNMDLISELIHKGLNDILTEVTSEIMNRTKSLQNRQTPGVTELSSGTSESVSGSHSASLSIRNTEKLWARKKSASLGSERSECGTNPKALGNEPTDFTLKNLSANNGERPKTEPPIISLPDTATPGSKVSSDGGKNTFPRISPLRHREKLFYKPTAQGKKSNLGPGKAKSLMSLAEEPRELLLDINTAANNVAVSEDEGAASHSETDQCRPQTPERFQWNQVLGTRSLSSGRHCWNVEFSESGNVWVGAAYPSIERRGIQSQIGNNAKSWGLYRSRFPANDVQNARYNVRHNSKLILLHQRPSSQRIRITLDYEGGSLSFYELSQPIRHLHTFTATFTEPLHAAFWVGAGASVRILRYI
ncbi:hypothetical protein XENTR_v10004514 [Xenopus tropicalis]|uniref:Uncharacterized protein n=1 Tax=Xenopus tropicalis TaxID=8364 RepID=A0A803JH30_XENTR|nr:hypothetical protein XENTR_v10004514 [Xenopus tropicalis]